MQTPSIQQARSRLESNTVELRKKKRIEQQLRRRVQVPETELVFDISLLSIEPRLVDSNQSPIELLQLLFGVLEIEPPTGQLHTCLACIQTIISSFTEEYASLHDAELRPLYELSSRRIKEYLDTSAYPAEIVHEALLLLSDLTASSTTFCYAYCELGGVEPLLNAYSCCGPIQLESFVLAIGNIASCDKDLGQLFLERNVSKILLSLLHTLDKNQKWQKQLPWTMSMLVRHVDIKPDDLFFDALQIFDKLKDLEDPVPDEDILWGSFVLTRKNDDCIVEFAKTSLLSFALAKLKQSSVKTSVSVLKVIGNLLSGSSPGSIQVSQRLIDLGVIELLAQYLAIPNDILSKEALWSLSNIAADNTQNAVRMFKPSIVPHAARGLWSQNTPLAIEASYLILNLAASLPCEVIERLHSEYNVFNLSDRRVESLDPKVLMNILLALRSFLHKVAQGDQLNSVLDGLEVGGWGAALEFVQRHENESIYAAAALILKEYFDAEVETFEFS